MKFYLITAAVFAVAWLVALFAVILPAWRHWHVGANVATRLESASVWAKIKIWFEGKKSVICGFFGSGFAAAKAAIGLTAAASVATAHAVNGLNPDDIHPLADKDLWTMLVGQSWALYITSILAMLGAVLALKSKIAALWIVPADKA